MKCQTLLWHMLGLISLALNRDVLFFESVRCMKIRKYLSNDENYLGYLF